MSADDDRLRARLAQAGFTPGRRDVAPLVDLVARADDDVQPLLRRALGRAPAEAVTAAIARALPDADDACAARMIAILGDAAAVDAAGAARAAVIAALDDPRPRVQRAAVVALGKLGGDDARAALAALWDRGGLDAALRRATADALGKVGGAAAQERLAGAQVEGDRELARRRDRALLISERDASEAPSTIVLDRAPPAPVVVIVRCRTGLEPLLAAELDEAGLVVRRLGVGRVAIDLAAPLSALSGSRTMLTAGVLVPIAAGPARAAARGRDEAAGVTAEAIAEALAAPHVTALLAAWTDGPIRWRLDFERGGHRRALVWAAAAAVRARAPALLNQPRQATWDVVIGDDERHLELRPRALGDERFAWRVAEIPAASHPSIAAALARVATPRDGERAWDPFVGSGGELCEVARVAAGPLVGTDLDERSLAAARANLTAAGAIDRTTLALGDALLYAPPPVDLVVTNPPMGMRLRGDAGALLERFAARLPQRLTARGRLVWLTPAPARTTPALRAAGLRRTFARDVDLGGHEVLLERWERAPR